MTNGTQGFIGRFRIINRTRDKTITHVKVKANDVVVKDEDLQPPVPPYGMQEQVEESPPVEVATVEVEVSAETPEGPRLYEVAKTLEPQQVVHMAEAELVEAPAPYPAPPGTWITWLILHLWTASGERRVLTLRGAGRPQWS